MEKILISAATSFEMAPLIDYLNKKAKKISFFEYAIGGKSIFPLVTGVGPVFTAFALARYLQQQEVDFVLGIGISGAYDRNLVLGQTVEVDRDQFGDIGIEESDGNFQSLFNLELMDGNTYPFSDGRIINNSKLKLDHALQYVSGLTMSKVTGTEKHAEDNLKQFNVQTESMEGASFAYACSMMRKDYAQIRCISNYVEARNKSNWKINLAIENLNNQIIKLLNIEKQATLNVL